MNNNWRIARHPYNGPVESFWIEVYGSFTPEDALAVAQELVGFINDVTAEEHEEHGDEEEVD